MGWLQKGRAPGREQILSRYEFRSDDYDFIDDPAASGAAAANLAAWTRMTADVASLGPSMSKRARMIFNPLRTGIFRFDTLGLVTPDFTDLQMLGYTFFRYQGTSYNDRFLTVGTSQDAVAAYDLMAEHRVSVECNNPTAHKWWAIADGGTVDPELFVGIRYRNMGNAKVVSKSSGFYINQQLMPESGAGAAISPGVGRIIGYCEWTWEESTQGKIFIDIRGNANSAWVNEHTHHIRNLACGSNMDSYGSAVGVRFSAEPSGYAGQNNHWFNKPCIQIGNGNFPAFVASAAKTSGQRIVSAGHEYLCTTSGTLSGSAPVHTDGSTVTNGSVSLKHLGRYHRRPLLLDGAGGYIAMVNGRQEGGYGAPVMFKGASVASGVGVKYNPMFLLYTESAAPLHGVATMCEFSRVGATTADVAGAAVASAPLVGGFVNENKAKQASMLGLGGQAIIGAFGLQIPGMHFWDTFALTTVLQFLDESFVTGPAIASHLASSLYFYDGSKKLGATVRLSNNARAFRFDFLSDPTDPLRWYAHAMDANGATVAHSGTSPAFLTATGNEIAPYNFTRDSVDTIEENIVFATKSTVDVIQLGFTNGASRGLVIAPIQTSQVGTSAVSFETPAGAYGGARVSRGAPVSGIFQTVGEFITNSHYGIAADTVKGWRIDTAGRKAWPWTTGQVVTLGSTRANASKIYEAKVAGTAGATAPTHSSGTVTDGAVTWRYLGAEATMTAE